MKRIFFSLLILFSTTISFAQVDVLRVSYEEGLKMAKEQDKILLIDCTTDGKG